MQKRGFSYLLHPLFFGALFVLIANDFFWKHHYHNWLTGKLSDVAGLVVLPVFLMAFFPKQKKAILVLTAFFFCWWKSPLSEMFIVFLNRTFSFLVSRVVDYTDLLALPALFLAGTLKPPSHSMGRWVAQGLQWAAGMVTVFALCATSTYRPLFMAHPASPETYFHESFTQKRRTVAILNTLAEKGVTYRVDSVMYYPILNQQNLYYRRQAANDSAITWQPVSQSSDSTLYLKRQGIPYYLIPAYQASEGRREVTFKNIRFTLSENKKGTKTTIVVETFDSPYIGPYAIEEKETKKAYKKMLEHLFAEEKE